VRSSRSCTSPERYLVLAVLCVQHSAQVTVEVVKVDVPEAACLIDGPADLERHLVHDAEHLLAGGPGRLDFVGFEAAEQVSRQALVE
jgi:hypothetical protein